MKKFIVKNSQLDFIVDNGNWEQVDNLNNYYGIDGVYNSFDELYDAIVHWVDGVEFNKDYIRQSLVDSDEGVVDFAIYADYDGTSFYASEEKHDASEYEELQEYADRSSDGIATLLCEIYFKLYVVENERPATVEDLK